MRLLDFAIAQVLARSPFYAGVNAKFLDAAVQQYDKETGNQVGDLA